MCCSVGFARSLGLALLPLALCCILANLLLLFPMGEMTYIEQGRLASYIWYFGGLGGGGLLVSGKQQKNKYKAHGVKVFMQSRSV